MLYNGVNKLRKEKLSKANRFGACYNINNKKKGYTMEKIKNKIKTILNNRINLNLVIIGILAYIGAMLTVLVGVLLNSDVF